ncbi:TPA: hypothetical protein KLE27_004598, partial [Shigella sonnei]|nr:hypothetical protein [Shigella sonnei]
KKTLLGASVIEHIEEDRETKTIKKCPACTKAHIKARTTVVPIYKCYNASCGKEFDHPLLVHKEVTTYRSDHAGGWVDLRGRLSGKQLHGLCIDTNPQHSLRRMRWQEFLRELGEDLSSAPWRPLERTADRMAGGHLERTVRVRIGQAQFRQDLLQQIPQEMKEPVCAFTGP